MQIACKLGTQEKRCSTRSAKREKLIKLLGLVCMWQSDKLHFFHVSYFRSLSETCLSLNNLRFAFCLYQSVQGFWFSANDMGVSEARQQFCFLDISENSWLEGEMSNFNWLVAWQVHDVNHWSLLHRVGDVRGHNWLVVFRFSVKNLLRSKSDTV